MLVTKKKLLAYIRHCVRLAEHYENTTDVPNGYHQLVAAFEHLSIMLGKSGEHWRRAFQNTSESQYGVQEAIGAVKEIEHVVKNNLLIRIEEMIRGDVFEDLLSQADHLQQQGYALAAGVLGRAVLEDHLRAMCEKAQCGLSTKKPTISHFYDALKATGAITATTHKFLIYIADIGNKAAHNKPEFDPEEVPKFLDDVRGFLTNHPI